MRYPLNPLAPFFQYTMTPDEKYMRMALSLARRGTGITSPNPMVGAVLVKDGRIIGKGYHKGPGRMHAEAEALQDAASSAAGSAAGATLYVTLEPCCHTDKRTPPCTKEIIKSGIERIVIGMTDPNPSVNGRGIRELADAGLKVENGVLLRDASKLNEIYSKFITTSIPYVIMKSASSLDGKIALASGEARWITGKVARRYAHKLRLLVDAVLAGIGTVLTDDPSLNVRNIKSKGKQPLRIILDSKLRIPLASRVLDMAAGQGTMVVTTKAAAPDRITTLENKGIRVLLAECREDGEVCLKSLMPLLGKAGITSILIEGGSRVNASALHEGIVDKVVMMFSPRIIGGKDSISMVGGTSPASLSESVFFSNISIRRLGEDIMIEGYVK